MRSSSKARRACARGRAQRAGCTAVHARCSASGTASKLWQATSLSRYSREARPRFLLTARSATQRLPQIPIYNETSSQAQRRTAKSLQAWASRGKLSRARGSQRPDLSPVRPQRRRSSAPGAVKAPRGPKNGAGQNPPALSLPVAQRPALLQEHYLRTPGARMGPAAEAVILCRQSMLAIFAKRRRRSAISVATTFEKYEDLQR